MDFDVTLPVDKVQSLIDCLIGNINFATARLKKIFLVEDLFDSLKFAAGTFIGETSQSQFCLTKN
jgi:hypothetical protein